VRRSSDGGATGAVAEALPAGPLAVACRRRAARAKSMGSMGVDIALLVELCHASGLRTRTERASKGWKRAESAHNLSLVGRMSNALFGAG